MAETHSIHLVSKPTKPNLDPTDIAASVLVVVRECVQALNDLHDYQETLIAGMGAQLNALELTALRAITPKVGRS